MDVLAVASITVGLTSLFADMFHKEKSLLTLLNLEYDDKLIHSIPPRKFITI